MLELWQGLALRLSVLRKSSRSQTLPAGEELLRILRKEQSTRRKPHLIVQAGRLLVHQQHARDDENISFAVLCPYAAFRPFFIFLIGGEI